MSELRVAVINWFFTMLFLAYMFSVLALILRTWAGSWNFGQCMPLLVRSGVRAMGAPGFSAGYIVKSGNLSVLSYCVLGALISGDLINGYIHLWQFLSSVVYYRQWEREHRALSVACDVSSLLYLSSRDLFLCENRIQM